MFSKLATSAGLEPATCRLEGGCSIQLSYEANVSRSSVRPLPDTGEAKIIGV
jgi:hypothetical protein